MSFIYGLGLNRMIQGHGLGSGIDWNNDVDTKAALSNATHVPNPDDEFYDDGGVNDLLDGELSGAGYTAGGNVLGSKTIVYDAASNELRFDGADVSWPGLNAGTIHNVTVLKHTGVANTSPVLVAFQSDAIPQLPVLTNGTLVTVQWHTFGVFGMAVS